MLKPGTVAPDFTITLDSGETFTLSDLRGKHHLVLYFFPKAFTAGCTREARGFRDAYDAIARLNAQVIGVSPDTHDTLARFCGAESLNFRLGADPDHRVSKAYDVRRRFNLGTSRITYVIDKHGVIRAVFHNEIDMASHHRKALEVLSTIEAEARDE